MNGEIDAYIGPRSPPAFDAGHPKIARLFPDPTTAASDYYRRTRIFPIMHVLGVRRSIAEAQPWLPAALLKAFEQSKAVALAKLSDTSATKITLPFVEEQLQAARNLDGAGFLVLRSRPQPPYAGGISRSPPPSGTVLASACRRGSLSPQHAGSVQDLKRRKRSPHFSLRHRSEGQTTEAGRIVPADTGGTG